MTLDNYDGSVAPSTRAALAAARAWDRQSWLFFAGGLGCGKTHLLAGIADKLLRERQPYVVRTGDALLEQIKAAYSMEGEMRLSYEAELRRMVASPIPLLVDDFGAGRQVSDWAWDQLDKLVCQRYGPPVLPLVATTNLAFSQLQAQLPRVADRLVQVGAWCQIEADTYRPKMANAKRK